MPIVEVESSERTIQKTIWFIEGLLQEEFDYEKHRILAVTYDDAPYFLEVVLCKVVPEKNLYGFRLGVRPNHSKETDHWAPLKEMLEILKYLESLVSDAFHIVALIENDIYTQEEFDTYLRDRFKDKTTEREAYFGEGYDDFDDDDFDDDEDELYSVN